MKVENLKLGDVVEVLWNDATAESGWVERGDIEWPENRCRSIAYFLHYNEDNIMLAGCLFEDYEKKDGTVGGIRTIPRAWIRKIRRLERATPGAKP